MASDMAKIFCCIFNFLKSGLVMGSTSQTTKQILTFGTFLDENNFSIWIFFMLVWSHIFITLFQTHIAFWKILFSILTCILNVYPSKKIGVFSAEKYDETRRKVKHFQQWKHQFFTRVWNIQQNSARKHCIF